MPFLRSFSDSPNSRAGTALIGVGLALLIVAAWWPGVPVVTAMAIIALGATEATLARFRRTTALLPVIVLNTATYASLYSLFVGTTLQAAAASSAAGLGGSAALDLAISVIPVAVAAQRIAGCLRQSLSPKQ